MSTFSKSTFNAVAYAASRPSYPPALYAHVLASAKPFPSPPATRTLLDLGCGPGLSTFAFLPHFSHVIGLDPSKNMVEEAKSLLLERQVDEGKKVDFRVGSGEDLKKAGVEAASVDLVVAGQAAHWFDAAKVYDELKRVLKPGGSFCFWGYGEFFLPDYPKSSALIPPYSAGTLGVFPSSGHDNRIHLAHH
ncbi:trans-aconitate 3-methyltransferase, partial [Phenoliferia sp. Uapishka_3]